MPQRSIVRKRKKARDTKRLANWRAKQEQADEKDASSKKAAKKTS